MSNKTRVEIEIIEIRYSAELSRLRDCSHIT